MLRDVSHLDTSTEVCGQKLNYPILLAPASYHRMVHPDGEPATARAAGAAGVEAVLRILVTELKAAMALCGRTTLASIDRSVLWKSP